MSVVDTNVKTTAVNLPIPGNDDSVDAVVFYNEIVSN